MKALKVWVGTKLWFTSYYEVIKVGIRMASCHSLFACYITQNSPQNTLKLGWRRLKFRTFDQLVRLIGSGAVVLCSIIYNNIRAKGGGMAPCPHLPVCVYAPRYSGNVMWFRTFEFLFLYKNYDCAPGDLNFVQEQSPLTWYLKKSDEISYDSKIG